MLQAVKKIEMELMQVSIVFLEVQGLYTAGEATRGLRGARICGRVGFARLRGKTVASRSGFAGLRGCLFHKPRAPMLLNQAESMRKGVMKGSKRGIELQD